MESIVSVPKVLMKVESSKWCISFQIPSLRHLAASRTTTPRTTTWFTLPQAGLRQCTAASLIPQLRICEKETLVPNESPRRAKVDAAALPDRTRRDALPEGFELGEIRLQIDVASVEGLLELVPQLLLGSACACDAMCLQ